jgi:hypothetical protein
MLAGTKRPPTHRRIAVSFLNELKRQTAALQPVETADPEARERNLRLAQGACRVTRDYWKELCDHLNVLKPPSAARYLIDGRNPLAGLRCVNFRLVPASRRNPAGEETFESVMLSWQAASGQRMRIEKDFPTEIDRVRAALRQAGIQSHESPVRSGSTGRPLGVAFEFTADVTVSIRLVPLPETGRVRLFFANLDQLERVEAEFPAVAMRPRQLDEIGRWIVGQPHRVLEYANEVRRYGA